MQANKQRMEYFRHSFLIKMIVIFMIIVFKTDIHNNHSKQSSIFSLPLSEYSISDSYNLQEGNYDFTFLANRIINTKNFRVRSISCAQVLLNKPITKIVQCHPIISKPNIILFKPISLRTLFCVYRL